MMKAPTRRPLFPRLARFGLKSAWPRRARQELQLLEARDVPSSSWQFDFNTSTSPVAPGYTHVPLTTYSAAQGFGWASITGLSAVDRNTADALTRDFHEGRDFTFRPTCRTGPTT
jgi:hypothetical protein